ncbi:type II toxin-antitoxin system VapC family toxin [Lusitaniella coriacea LEGE 07157]|uniref:Type II toxin-antitoxin system VapC family toxin n=1 Tax=Lusitaniella coriacea LEGE 07157 TaxID=945747 RepID=A0A8J7DSX4_9CYAN|nr:type II toxin-antitoxin system VapC family toxin [Lusitaniella coriacea]MBE9114937.1 type II toxin-antitoxin system VapC family toxin [Lusitaniella coriacea LEGE 07157]
MFYLVDTNVLLRLTNRSDPQHPIVRNAMRQLRRDKHQLRIAPQNCIEFWNVATRPIARNGLGLTPANAEQLLSLLERLFPVLPDSPTVYTEWRRLVINYGVSGVQVHDAHLIAAMKVNSTTHILTFNTTDFTRYASEGIIAVDPATV